MKRTTRHWVALGGLAVAMVGATLIWTWRADDPATVGEVTSSVDPAGDERINGRAAPTALALAAIPTARPLPTMEATALPPEGTPLADIVEELEARAESGDRKAACRLAMDAAFCRAGAPNQDAVQSLIEQSAARTTTAESDIVSIERAEVLAKRAGSVCANLPTGWAEDRAWRYMVRAAELGDTDLALQFVVKPPLSRFRFLEQREAWDTYARLAPQFLRQAAEQGDLYASFYFQRALAGRSPLIGMPNAVRPDVREAAAYALALQRHVTAQLHEELQREIDAYRRNFSDAQWQEVNARAERLIRQPVEPMRVAEGGEQLPPNSTDSSACADR